MIGADIAVDIVIDNYNYGAFLPAAIESACGQSHPRVNVIVVDDGSNDGSREVIAEHAGEIDVVLKKNGGQASALNAGMERCRGVIVIFLDADDVLQPHVAARVAATFGGDESLAKVQYRMDTIDAEGNPIGAVKPASHTPMPSGDLRHDELAFPYDMAWLPTSGNAFRTDAIRRLFPIPEDEYRICADWYLVHTATLLGRVASLEEIGASYRVHGANTYEPQAPCLDLAHMRTNVRLARSTSRVLLGLAAELDLERPERILSLADLANRLISLRLDPAGHPIRSDRAAGLVADAVRATRRRTSASAPLKAVFVTWFALMAITPRTLARPLAELFLFPERRSSLNPLLGRLQRKGPDQPSTASRPPEQR